MIILTIIGVSALFVVLWLLASRGEEKTRDNTLVFNIPNEIIACHRPAMPLDERERRRRRLLSDTFALGFYAREEYERKQLQDHELTNTPYFIRNSK